MVAGRVGALAPAPAPAPPPPLQHAPPGLDQRYTCPARHLLLPYAGWTVAYLLASVSMHAFAPLRIISALLLGTAAPHLWYVVMMFQFQLLAPACRRARLCVARGRGHTAVLLSFGFLTSLAYILQYRHFSPALPSWADLLFNRGFIGFMAFGCLGIAILAEEERGARWPAVIPPLAGLLVVPVFLLACREALPHGIAPSLHQVIYLKPSTFLYNVLLLAAAYGGARFCVLRGWGAGPAIRWLSSMAYKAFLANVFVSRLILWCLGLVNLEVTNLPSLLAVWLATAIGSFALAHAIDCLGKSMIYMNWRPERIRHDVHE